jgi:triphosphoribosyl-dephospho-CoA synthase
MILLLAPLAAVPARRPLRAGVAEVLSQLTSSDAADVYRAIQLAGPGGMGERPRMDIGGPPPDDLLAAMRDAQDRDLVARQFVTDFAVVFDDVVPLLHAGGEAGWTLTHTIVHTHVRMMARYPDSLIARKCGERVARQAQLGAERVLAAGQPGEEEYTSALADFDFWLRSDHHRRNPGTTADLIAAGLYVGLREQTLLPPWR